MIRRPPRSTLDRSSAASDVYKRQFEIYFIDKFSNLMKIALLSDTHSYFGEDINKYLREVDEIWHAGDIGDLETADKYLSLIHISEPTRPY